ncbi:MAG: hypothetical protein IPN14_17005 [Bacteroidetes bacterium]|nr:hypothetical protein [Bacteroidota bacterium]
MKCRTTDDLAQACQTDANQLVLFGLKPRYKEYYIPKNKGEMRLIEDPSKELKKIQTHLNKLLQAWYYTQRSDASHGFGIATSKDEQARGIKTNASVHLQCNYLLNIDLLDFFHQIEFPRLQKTFETYLPKQKADIRNLLLQVCCYKNRLPMGAPTSPVLSNIACLDLDGSLQQLCKHANLNFTRYADDLSFSSLLPIEKEVQDMIKDAIMHEGFSINYNKVNYFSIEDEKLVTGLVLHPDGVRLPKEYVPLLLKEIERLKIINDVEYRYQTGMSRKKLNLLEQEIQGKIRFVSDVLGSHAIETLSIEKAYLNAIQAPEDFESLSWLELPYEFL